MEGEGEREREREVERERERERQRERGKHPPRGSEVGSVGTQQVLACARRDEAAC